MNIHLDLELPQIFQLVNQLAPEDKAELARYLDSQTLFTEFQNFVDSKAHIDLTEDQIAQEVHSVRQLRA